LESRFGRGVGWLPARYSTAWALAKAKADRTFGRSLIQNAACDVEAAQMAGPSANVWGAASAGPRRGSGEPSK